MRILLSCPNDGQTNNYIINALQDLGHDVAFVDHRRFLEQSVKSVPYFLKEWGVELFLVLYLVPGYTYPIEFIKELKSKFPNVKYASWILDTRVPTLPDINSKSNLLFCDNNVDFVNIVKSYDYFFTIVKGQVQKFIDQGVNAFHVPEGYDHYTARFTFADQDIPVSFMGQVNKSVFPNRFEVVKSVFKEFNTGRIYGAVEDDADLLRVAVGRNTFNDVEHSRVVGRTKVNLGHCEWPDLAGSFSARAYRIMGSGGFFMMNEGHHIDGAFEIGKELITYSSIDDCIDKIRYYLTHTEERKQIAEAGQARVFRDYTFAHSMRKMIGIIND